MGRTISAMELKRIAEIKKYRQPKCPGCANEMILGYGHSQTRPGLFEAWYYCPHDGWNVWPQYDNNAAFAVEKAYKAASVRRG